MPVTINGIGTHYYGEKNLESHVATCPHCNRQATLKSYDTRLWFVIVYVPIIPLARKRIVDDCSSCRKHFAIDADKWDQIRKKEISGSEEKFREDPTPENAIKVHQQMMTFRQFAQAAVFRNDATGYFPENAKLQAFFGDSLTFFGRLKEAEPFYQRAYTLQPDLPEARIGLADAHIRAGRLDQARPLLDFLEKPGAGKIHSLEVVERLVLALQKSKRHEEALVLCKILKTEFPKITDHPGFRKYVKRSEKALHQRESLLPPLPFGWKRFFGSSAQPTTRNLLIVGLVAACVILGFVFSNEYVRQHRTLHIVNNYAQPAKVSIAGVGEFPGVRDVLAVPLSEGRYHATISGPVQEELDFEVSADYFDRWGDDPAWVINVGGAAVLVRQEATYGTTPPPARYTFHFGKTFEAFDGITNPFTALPATVQLKSYETKTLVELQVHHGGGMEIFGYLAEHNNATNTLDFAEAWLRSHPQDDDLLGAYLSLAGQKNLKTRVNAYLRPRLAQRPVLIDWHRAYQHLHAVAADLPALTAEYDATLAAEPENASLLYLRGRIETDRTANRDFFNRSIKADAKLPYPLYGLAWDHITQGEWSAARDLMERVVTLAPDNDGFQERLMYTRLGAGDFAQVEEEASSRIARDATDSSATYRLIEALALQDKKADANKANEAYGRVLRAKFGDRSTESIKSMALFSLYATGDFSALEKVATQAGRSQSASLFAATIEQGKTAEAVKTLKLVPDDQPINQLALAAVWQLAGKTEECDKALAAARVLFAAGDEDSIPAAILLDPAKPLVVATALDLKINPREKSLLLVVLALRHPEHRDALLPLASQLNIEPIFPYHLIRRVTAGPI